MLQSNKQISLQQTALNYYLFSSGLCYKIFLNLQNIPHLKAYAPLTHIYRVVNVSISDQQACNFF